MRRAAGVSLAVTSTGRQGNDRKQCDHRSHHCKDRLFHHISPPFSAEFDSSTQLFVQCKKL
jgi:hypothetical protein